ncbi:MAG TPA: hypothetical protein VIJ75_04515 [Hanamia sp.]
MVDKTPIDPVTDALSLLPLCDVTLYVARYAYTSRVFLEQFEEKSKTKTIKKLAIVYNGIRGKGVNKYGYGYGYGYAEDTDKKGLRNFFKG